MFPQNVLDGEQNFLWSLNLIYDAHNGKGVGLPDCLSFSEKFHFVEFWVTSYTTLAMFSENLRVGEQNFLWSLNLIYDAHNGKGVGLPDCLPFFAKFHYVEIWVTSCTTLAMFSQNIREGEQNFLRILNLIYGVHNGRGVGLSKCLPFLVKFHYIEFWVTSYTMGGCPLKECFHKTSAMEGKTFCWFLISYMMTIMVGVWVYQIVYLFRKNSIKLEFWVTSYTMGGCLPKQFFLPTSAMESKTFCGFLISYMMPIMVRVWV